MLEPLPIELAGRYEIQLEQTGIARPLWNHYTKGCATTGISATSTGTRRTSSKAFRGSTRSSAPNISRNLNGTRRGAPGPIAETQTETLSERISGASPPRSCPPRAFSRFCPRASRSFQAARSQARGQASPRPWPER